LPFSDKTGTDTLLKYIYIYAYNINPSEVALATKTLYKYMGKNRYKMLHPMFYFVLDLLQEI